MHDRPDHQGRYIVRNSSGLRAMLVTSNTSSGCLILDRYREHLV